MKDLFTIGEISKIFGINPKTLRYYDEIHLFKPIFTDSITGYRYYSSDQFEQLNTINYLKVLEMPLKDIKKHLDNRSINYINELLKKQKLLTEQRINSLLAVQKKIDLRINFLDSLKDIKLDKIEEISFQARSVYYLKTDIKNNFDIELSIKKLEKLENINNGVFIGKVGLSLNKENIINENFDNYNGIFILIEDDEVKNPNTKTFEKGIYVTLSFRGTHKEAPLHYKTLLEYIKLMNYKIIGDSFERTLIDFALTDDISEYITEIQIPIKKIDITVTG